MKIELNDKEYKQLVKIVFAGNWLINSMRDEPVEEYIDIEQFIYSLNKGNPKQKLVEYDESYDMYIPTHALEDEMSDWIDDYNEYNFWQELIERLAAKDILNEKGEEEIENMDETEEQEQLKFHAEKYNDEFEDHGIRNLTVNFKGDK